MKGFMIAMDVNMKFNMYIPTKILFGEGKLNELGSQKMPGKKALLVISSGKSVRENGALARTEEQLKAAGVDFVLFDKIMQNPIKRTVMEGAALAKANGCDFVVALGGGSVMDSGKAIAIMVNNEGDLWDYAGGKTGKRLPLKNPPVPIVCITTTAGTGSEVDAGGVITNEETNEKINVAGYKESFPVLSIVDPELMKTVPPKYTAYQGFDALLQSIECYISYFNNIMSDMYALTSIEYAGKYLPRAVKDGNDMEARSGMAFANTLSGVAMVLSSTTAEHSMEHAMSAYHPDLPHGAGLIMISKAFFQFFIDKHVCDERFVRMAKALGMESAQKPDDFITALVKLQQDCVVAGLKMSDYCIEPSEFDELARNAREAMGPLFAGNPYPMSHEDCVEIYRKSYK